jgi:hypothetical protein
VSIIESFLDLCLRTGAPEPCAWLPSNLLFIGDPAIGENSSWRSVVGTYKARDGRAIDVVASWSTVVAPRGDYIVWKAANTPSFMASTEIQ